MVNAFGTKPPRGGPYAHLRKRASDEALMLSGPNVTAKRQ